MHPEGNRSERILLRLQEICCFEVSTGFRHSFFFEIADDKGSDSTVSVPHIECRRMSIGKQLKEADCRIYTIITYTTPTCFLG